jgi:hypothetical protein
MSSETVRPGALGNANGGGVDEMYRSKEEAMLIVT